MLHTLLKSSSIWGQYCMYRKAWVTMQQFVMKKMRKQAPVGNGGRI